MNRSCRQGLLCVVWNCWSVCVCVRVCVCVCVYVLLLLCIPYSENFKGENFCKLLVCTTNGWDAPTFCFTNSHKTLKFTNILSLKKFSAIQHVTTGNLTQSQLERFTSSIFLLSRDSRGGGSSSEQTAHTTSLYRERIQVHSYLKGFICPQRHRQFVKRCTSRVSWQPEGYTKNSCWNGRGVGVKIKCTVKVQDLSLYLQTQEGLHYSGLLLLCAAHPRGWM